MSDYLLSHEIEQIRKHNEDLKTRIIEILKVKDEDYVKQVIKVSFLEIKNGNYDIGRIIVEEGIKYLETAEIISLLTKLMCSVNRILDMKYFAYYKLKQIIDTNLQAEDKIKNKTVYRKYNELMKQLLKDETIDSINLSFRNNINFI